MCNYCTYLHMYMVNKFQSNMGEIKVFEIETLATYCEPIQSIFALESYCIQIQKLLVCHPLADELIYLLDC